MENDYKVMQISQRRQTAVKDKYGENQEWEENRRRKEDADPGAVKEKIMEVII